MHDRATPSLKTAEVTVEEFVKLDDVWPLLPLPFPDRPVWKRMTSCTLRARQKRRFQTWRRASGLVRVINGLDSGGVSTKLTPSGTGGLVKATAARTLSIRSLLRVGSDFDRVRRSLGLTGVHSATASLMKTPLDEWGYMRKSTVKQVPMIADRIKEPSDQSCIDMLDVLPEEDAIYYGEEKNVIDRAGKSEQLFKEIEEQYGFIGGSKEEYIKYLHRPDVQYLWKWDVMDNIKAIAGVSTVLKKNQHDQRKLIMQCAANYAFQDPRDRADLGMGGGGALCRLRVPSDHIATSACDEDTAFTYVKVPEWMSAWQAGPPLQAFEVQSLLPEEVKGSLNSLSDFVAPRYVRLAMGGSHSVYILMRINLEHIGRSLLNYGSRLRLDPTSEGELKISDCDVADAVDLQLETEVACPDSAWATRQQQRRDRVQDQGGFSVDGWCDHVRRLKHLDKRTMVIMHFFCGERRHGDIEYWLNSLKGDLQVSMVSIDLANDADWDFTNPCTYHKIMQLIEEGLVDVVLGGPPCSTVARSRHVPLQGGPRPLRFRWCIWGRHDLWPHELERVREANTLWINYMSVCENVAARGGAWLWEHPADPGHSPYASVWATPEMVGLEKHQCSESSFAPMPVRRAGSEIDLLCRHVGGTVRFGRSAMSGIVGYTQTRSINRQRSTRRILHSTVASIPKQVVQRTGHQNYSYAGSFLCNLHWTNRCTYYRGLSAQTKGHGVEHTSQWSFGWHNPTQRGSVKAVHVQSWNQSISRIYSCG